MCGLVGVAGKSNGEIDNMFRILLTLDVVRGEHSTGVLLVDSNGDSAIHKVVGHPYNLFDSRAYHQDLAYCTNVVMGHNRWASKGAINRMNAHPFEHGHLIGAHNGTLTTQYLLDDNKEYDVDSDNLFHHMELNGVNDTCKLLGGAFALTWYDSKEETINFVRNEKRPFFYAYSKDKKNIMWASEKWMLTVASEKSGVKMGNIMELPLYKHHSLLIPCMAGENYPELGKMDVVEVEAYVPPKKQELSVVRSTCGGNKSTTLTATYFSLLNTWVDFTVIGTHPMYKHMVEVHVIGHPDIKARVICKKTSPVHKEMLLNVGVCFTGKVWRVSQNSSWSISINPKTVVETYFEDVEEDIPEGEYPVGFPVEMKSLAEWREAVQKGCSWCSDVPQNGEEAKHLVWYSADEHVCPHCAGDIDIKRYLHLD